jgi:hypothetical protein
MTMTATGPAGAREFSRYLGGLEGQDAPLLGHLVLYSVFESQVTPGQLALWFDQLGLDKIWLPGDIRPVDVYERITGPAGVKKSYRLGEPQTRSQVGRLGARGQWVTLMVRHVSRDNDKIVRHVVREVRDEEQARLSYTAKVGEVIFRRDPDSKAAHGAGQVEINPEVPALAQLPASEMHQVLDCLEEISREFEAGRLYLSSDRLRAMIRKYIENLLPVRIRSGVYFVGRQHAETLGKLRELVSRFTGKSNLTRIPLPDQDEQRDMIIAAFISQTDYEIRKLSADIRAAIDDGASDAVVQRLTRRFRELKASASEHEQLLGASVEDAHASMEVVEKQLKKLLDL